MIERGHEHLLRPVSTQDLPDGRKLVHSICVCSLEEQRVTRGKTVTSLKFRFGGLWFTPLDLLRVSSSISVMECPTCGGAIALTPCDLCHGLGVTDPDGNPLEPRSLKVS